jgi:hypothetical protein
VLIVLAALAIVPVRNAEGGGSGCELNCPFSITTGNDPGQCGAIVNYNLMPVNCGTIQCTPPDGSFFPVGTMTVFCEGILNGPGATGIFGPTCVFDVTVTDTESLTITCPDFVTAECAGSSTPVTFEVTAGDNCGLPTVDCSPPSGSSFSPGSTTVFCSATDGTGNMTSCSFTVFVGDSTPPQVTCPADITTTEDTPGSGSAVVNYIASCTDPCGLNDFNCTPPAGSSFPVGTTTVTCTCTDATGNTAACAFMVTVEPSCTITCPDDITAIAGDTTAIVEFAPTTSNCGTLTVDCNPPSGNAFPVGTTTVTCEVLQDTINPTCTFTVEVISACDAIEAIIAVLDAARTAGDIRTQDFKPLVASLKGACDAFIKGNTGSGINKLEAFQNKVRSHLGTSNPTLAMDLIAMAQDIIDAVNGP